MTDIATRRVSKRKSSFVDEMNKIIIAADFSGVDNPLKSLDKTSPRVVRRKTSHAEDIIASDFTKYENPVFKLTTVLSPQTNRKSVGGSDVEAEEGAANDHEKSETYSESKTNSDKVCKNEIDIGHEMINGRSCNRRSPSSFCSSGSEDIMSSPDLELSEQNSCTFSHFLHIFGNTNKYINETFPDGINCRNRTSPELLTNDTENEEDMIKDKEDEKLESSVSTKTKYIEPLLKGTFDFDKKPQLSCSNDLTKKWATSPKYVDTCTNDCESAVDVFFAS